MSIAATGSGYQPVYSSLPTTAPAAGSNAGNNSGLVFSAGFATYNGQPIALSDIIDDKTSKFTEAQQDQANETLQAREKAAYGQYEGTDTQEGNKEFVQAYIKYVQGLPLDEQNSQRYRGTLQSAQNLLNEINGTSSDSDTGAIDPKAAALRILKGSETAQQKAKDAQKNSKTSGTTAPTDTITLSATAQAYMVQTSSVPQLSKTTTASTNGNAASLTV